MKTRVSLQRTPNSKFDGVARSIAKGDPPDWLVLGLQHFSGGIGVDVSKKDRRSFDTILKQMQGAVHTLTTWSRRSRHSFSVRLSWRTPPICRCKRRPNLKRWSISKRRRRLA